MPFMFDRAMLEDSDFISAWNVAVGEMNGRRFDWSSETWIQRPA
jgi:hypothetical protein